MNYKLKIDKILEDHSITQAQLAEYLNITPRTLADFIREDREPGGSVARLLDVMAGEKPPWSERLLKNRRLFVAVHRGFVHQPNQKPVDPVEVTVEVSRHAQMSVTNSADEEYNFISEMHYVDYSPTSETEWSDLEKLKAQNIRPSLLWGFSSEDKSAETILDNHFSATIMWQISNNAAGSLSDIVIAAEFDKFWPLARYIKEVTNANVIYAFINGPNESVKARLNRHGLLWISLSASGRMVGKIIKNLKGYGYILTDDGKHTFYHWNSMHKNVNGEPEFLFEQIPEGSRVSFVLDKNHKGPCAIDVKIIELNEDGKIELPPEVTPVSISRKSEKFSKDNLCDAIKDAIETCAGENGEALTADVGHRIAVKLRVSCQDILKSLKYPNPRLSEFVNEYPLVFKTRDDATDATGRCKWIKNLK